MDSLRLSNQKPNAKSACRRSNPMRPAPFFHNSLGTSQNHWIIPKANSSQRLTYIPPIVFGSKPITTCEKNIIGNAKMLIGKDRMNIVAVAVPITFAGKLDEFVVVGMKIGKISDRNDVISQTALRFNLRYASIFRPP